MLKLKPPHPMGEGVREWSPTWVGQIGDVTMLGKRSVGQSELSMFNCCCCLIIIIIIIIIVTIILFLLVEADCFC